MQTILEQFEQMLQRGRIPLFEYELNNGEFLLVHIDCTENEIKFNFDDSFGSVYFDGDIQGENGYYSYEFDNEYDTLDSLLELIDANITEGYILPNGLYMEDIG